ncbi:MAG: DUF4303 domain-containing protein [Pirellulales bacterium]
MAKKKSSATSAEAIASALAVDATAFLEGFRKKHAKETIYAFLLELSAVGYAAGAAIATEESLRRFAEDCVEDFDGDLEKALRDMRWAGPEEESWYQSPEKAFRISNQLLEIAEETELYPEYDGSLEKIALSALKSMMKEGAFGTKQECDAMVISICHTGGDNSAEDFLRWASSINSPKVMKRLKKEYSAADR